MRWLSMFLILLAAWLPPGALMAQVDALDACHARSSYDLTLEGDALLFDRAGAAPRKVRMHDGELVVDGTAVELGPADQGRINAFERGVRALVPEARAIADQGVDLAAEAVREQARESAPALVSSGELDVRLEREARDLKARIAGSRSTHDWHGAAFQQYASQRLAGVVPLLAGGLLQQSVGLAMGGDLEGVARLREQAANLAATLQARIQRKLGQLRPRIQALCPAVNELDRLENGLDARMPDGSRLNLLTVER